MSDKKFCAITGSNGYVGGCVKNYFVVRGWEIFELTRRPKAGTRAAQFQLGDDLSPQLLSGVSALVHCAYDFKPLRWKEITEVNIEGSRKILEAARAAGIPKVVYISSISAFDGCKSLYGKAKLEIEKIALANGALVIRPGLVWGNPAGAMVGKLVEQVQTKSIIPMIGNGSQIQFLIHNEDLCRFIEQFANSEIKGGQSQGLQILTAANPQPWPFKQLLLEIARAFSKQPRFIPLPWRLDWLGL